FGDLHVHTTFSADAFVRSLPMLQGEGAHPPADACDFARFCSALDFWSINDHAEAISPQHWRETKESIRQCNALAGDAKNPDFVAFLGWEWTQVGIPPETHYGHKNVIFRDTADDRVPTRPISALDRNLVGALPHRPPLWQRLRFPLLDWANRQAYFDFGAYQQELAATPTCPEGVDTRQLPENCSETAHTPQALFEKLAQWGFDTIVIPHGNTWGFYTPPGSSWDKQLTAAHHHPDRQTLIEVFSGHGNSEEYRGFQDVAYDAQGALLCPEPTATYLPCCWQAGETGRALGGKARRGVHTPRRRGATELPTGRRRRACHDAMGDARGLEELRAVHRLLPARLQLPAQGLGTVRARPLELRRPGGTTSLPLRLPPVERQPQCAAGDGVQGVRAPRHDRGGRRPRRGLAAAPDRGAKGARGAVDALRPRESAGGDAELSGPGFRAPGVVLPDRRPGGGPQRGTGSRRHLVGAQTSPGLRDERRAHLARVGPTERPRRSGADGRGGPAGRGTALPRPRRRLLPAAAGLPGLGTRRARRRAPRAPLPR